MKTIYGEAACAALSDVSSPARASVAALKGDRPDEMLAVVDAAGRAVARASLWWREAPPEPGRTVGVVGHFYAGSEAAAVCALEAAWRRLREAGCTVAYGPMDGNTWRRYRFAVEGDGSAPFFLEPSNDPEWPAWWEAAGFAVAARYSSSRMRLPAPSDPRASRAASRLTAAGVSIRNLDATRLEDELRAVFRVTLAAFAGAHLYTPAAESDFMGRYLALGSSLRPEYVLIAEHGGRVVGYLFAIPDLNEMARTGSTRTLVAKTIAVLPGREYAGLGAVLSERMYAVAHAAGFTDLVHALQYDGNASAKNLSGDGLSLVRRYALYGRAAEGVCA